MDSKSNFKGRIIVFLVGIGQLLAFATCVLLIIRGGVIALNTGGFVLAALGAIISVYGLVSTLRLIKHAAEYARSEATRPPLLKPVTLLILALGSAGFAYHSAGLDLPSL